MKTQLLSLAILLSVLGSVSVSHANNELAQLTNDGENVSNGSMVLHNDLPAGMSAWVTIYNGFRQIRDVGCVNAGSQISFDGYYSPMLFGMRTEVANGLNCNGQKVGDLETNKVGGIEASLRILDGKIVLIQK